MTGEKETKVLKQVGALGIDLSVFNYEKHKNAFIIKDPQLKGPVIEIYEKLQLNKAGCDVMLLLLKDYFRLPEDFNPIIPTVVITDNLVGISRPLASLAPIVYRKCLFFARKYPQKQEDNTDYPEYLSCYAQWFNKKLPHPIPTPTIFKEKLKLLENKINTLRLAIIKQQLKKEAVNNEIKQFKKTAEKDIQTEKTIYVNDNQYLHLIPDKIKINAKSSKDYAIVLLKPTTIEITSSNILICDGDSFLGIEKIDTHTYSINKAVFGASYPIRDDNPISLITTVFNGLTKCLPEIAN